MPTVLLTYKIPSSVMVRLEAVAGVERLDPASADPRAQLLARVEGKDALISMVTDRIDRDVLEAGRALKIVANVAVGYNNIDLAAARERGIVVTNTPGVLTAATADLTWALILGITRRVGEGERLVRREAWPGWAFDQLLGMELAGKQLGIVGFGRIGRAVAQRAVAFDMRVAYAARTPRAAAVQTRGAAEATPLPLDQLLATSDVVSIHVPLTADTTHLINQQAFARMKRSAYLVNTSRGPVVDESALVWAMKNRLIAGAALDVYEREPAIDADLLAFENVLLAPHLGSATTEARTAMADLAVRNVIAVLAGDPPVTPVS